ncbi:protein-tyrosine-phosphatase, partial [Lactobacillus sp. XV13L]|nr:protein-tyrosine-phosphatase [Lactobacillus sp. XV13L]
MSQKLTNQLIGIKSGRNFRELGGYHTTDGRTIKMNKLLRTAKLKT